ncbi:hypothetical protein [Streptomyces sp. NPDC048521]|uniref:hypothetical protein n=1 Tax=Streptomyces sp. NPDC048521 TaxID=3365566 RepID=UPI003717F642
MRWVQEEPENQGAWSFVTPHVHRVANRPVGCISRPPASGQYPVARRRAEGCGGVCLPPTASPAAARRAGSRATAREPAVVDPPRAHSRGPRVWGLGAGPVPRRRRATMTPARDYSAVVKRFAAAGSSSPCTPQGR